MGLASPYMCVTEKKILLLQKIDLFELNGNILKNCAYVFNCMKKADKLTSSGIKVTEVQWKLQKARHVQGRYFQVE